MAATLITQPFLPLAEGEKQALGMPSYPLVVIPHNPAAHLVRDKIRREAEEAFPRLMAALTQPVRVRA